MSLNYLYSNEVREANHKRAAAAALLQQNAVREEIRAIVAVEAMAKELEIAKNGGKSAEFIARLEDIYTAQKTVLEVATIARIAQDAKCRVEEAPMWEEIAIEAKRLANMPMNY